MSRTLYPVILSGGSGTRLWPLSRDLLPKQLLALVGEESLLAATARRVAGDRYARPVVVCNQDHRFMVSEQLAAIGIEPEAIIIEPVARNTAPAIAAAAELLRARDPDALMLVLPSDHIVRNGQNFAAAVETAVAAAEAGYLVTFGITPTAPETGYGYICSGDPIAGINGAYRIGRFVEKPDLATAAAYLAEGNWCWNSGMFVFPVGLMLEELASFEPAIPPGVSQAVQRAIYDGGVVALDAEAFGAVPSNSIDYALMERTSRSAMVPANLGWSDVGSWSALWEIADRDSNENCAIGDVMVEDTTGSYLRSTGPLVAALGLKDVVIVATPDVVMAAAKDRAQDVKKFVGRLRNDGRHEGTVHTIVHRPWGSYQILDSGAGFQVRRLTVKPNARMSLQRHAQRAEHWVVVSGKARVTRDEDVLILRERMSIDIPLGAAHRLENAGQEPLEMIEVQTGPLLTEEDIVRLTDDHERS